MVHVLLSTYTCIVLVSSTDTSTYTTHSWTIRLLRMCWFLETSSCHLSEMGLRKRNGSVGIEAGGCDEGGCDEAAAIPNTAVDVSLAAMTRAMPALSIGVTVTGQASERISSGVSAGKVAVLSGERKGRAGSGRAMLKGLSGLDMG
jgi:hypothetical protein